MISQEQIEKIKNSNMLNKFEVILYGSQATGNTKIDSDIDLAVITRIQNKRKNLDIYKEILGCLSNNYDIRIFELLPIYIQISIIENYRVIIGDPVDISEYLYQYRQKWDDCKHRIMENQFHSFQERLKLRDKYESQVKK